MAPELVPGEADADSSPKPTKEADVYSFSMVALEVLTDKQPFFSLRLDITVVVHVQTGKRPQRLSYLPTIFTDQMWELFVNCWDQKPERRPTIRTVVQRLEAM